MSDQRNVTVPPSIALVDVAHAVEKMVEHERQDARDRISTRCRRLANECPLTAARVMGGLTDLHVLLERLVELERDMMAAEEEVKRCEVIS